MDVHSHYLHSSNLCLVLLSKPLLQKSCPDETMATASYHLWVASPALNRSITQGEVHYLLDLSLKDKLAAVQQTTCLIFQIETNTFNCTEAWSHMQWHAAILAYLLQIKPNKHTWTLIYKHRRAHDPVVPNWAKENQVNCSEAVKVIYAGLFGMIFTLFDVIFMQLNPPRSCLSPPRSAPPQQSSRCCWKPQMSCVRTDHGGGNFKKWRSRKRLFPLSCFLCS